MLVNKKHQKGFIQLSLIAVLFLTGALFAVTKLASNPNLTFFNTSSEASGIDQKNCTGCNGKYELRWDRKAEKCTKKESLICKKPAATTTTGSNTSGSNNLPECGDGLYCAHQQTAGASSCKDSTRNPVLVWESCCPSGQIIQNKKCVAQTTSNNQESTGARCPSGLTAGNTYCSNGDLYRCGDDGQDRRYIKCNLGCNESISACNQPTCTPKGECVTNGAGVGALPCCDGTPSVLDTSCRSTGSRCR